MEWALTAVLVRLPYSMDLSFGDASHQSSTLLMSDEQE